MWTIKIGKSKTFLKSEIVRLSDYNLIFGLPCITKEPSENSPSLKYRHLIMFYQTSGDLKILKIQGLLWWEWEKFFYQVPKKINRWATTIHIEYE